jgi:hypothetical protein
MGPRINSLVMPGLVPAIHVLCHSRESGNPCNHGSQGLLDCPVKPGNDKFVDGRDKPGHDGARVE